MNEIVDDGRTWKTKHLLDVELFETFDDVFTEFDLAHGGGLWDREVAGWLFDFVKVSIGMFLQECDSIEDGIATQFVLTITPNSFF